MTAVIIFIGIVILVSISLFLNQGYLKPKRAFTYHYKRKNYLMTKAENDFFDVLIKAVGDKYYVFPQMHLSAFLLKDKGQEYWKGAQDYINKISVDYVICDKQYRQPLLAIELDDWSHDNKSRIKRDGDVQRVLKEAGLPLLRFRDIRDTSSSDIVNRIQDALTL